MNQIYCTFEDYDKFCEVFDNMFYKTNGYAPTLEEIHSRISPNLNEYIVFLIWILETGVDTEENKECRDAIREILNQNFLLVEELPEGVEI